MMQHASLTNWDGEQSAHIETSDLGKKLEQAVHMALNEVVAILGFSLNPDDRAFSSILKAKTTILTSVLNAQVRVDERRFVKEDTEHDRAMERLRHNPAMRWIVGGNAALGAAASPSQMGRFETRWLTAEKNLSALADLSGQWIDTVHGCRPPRGIVLDMDSSVSPTHGEQENSVWNGHYACTCYHPLFVFN
jgi:hypothetical protein